LVAAECEWRTAAAGLKPFRLPRALEMNTTQTRSYTHKKTQIKSHWFCRGDVRGHADIFLLLRPSLC